ncbi:MAG: hypothetical protein AAGK37_02060 [Pseudomonadota bacterium]
MRFGRPNIRHLPTLCLLLLALPALGDTAHGRPPAAIAGAVAGAIASDGPFGEALERALDPPVCCQLRAACRGQLDRITTGEAKSLCLSENGQPLVNQYCHADGMCRP